MVGRDAIQPVFDAIVGIGTSPLEKNFSKVIVDVNGNIVGKATLK